MPHEYEEKFADFIRLCRESKANRIPNVVVGFPSALGDNYQEIIESLSRLADAGLTLSIAGRNPDSRQN